MDHEQVLLENKRECFDGMWAYHQSEISHANHAITMLLAISGVVGAVVIAILFPDKPPTHVCEIVWGLFVVVFIFGVTIAGSAHIKISGDHTRYEEFGAEYVKTSEHLGLYSKEKMKKDGPTVNSDPIKTDRTIGKGKGFRKTQFIIWFFTAVLVIVTMIFAIIVTCTACQCSIHCK